MNDLNRMKKLAGILTESVMAIPGVGEKIDEKAPKGWEGTVKSMKKHPEIENPWALAHYMKGKGYKSHKEESVEENTDDFPDIRDQMSGGRDQDDEFDASGYGQGFPGLDEKAPPGMEDMVMKLKKQYPGEPEKAFATAWSIYNKKHGKTDESVPAVDSCQQSNPATADEACAMNEDQNEDVKNAINRLQQLSDAFVPLDQALEQIEKEFTDFGYTPDQIQSIMSAVDAELWNDEPTGGINDMSDDADALASAGHGSDEDYGVDDVFEATPGLDKRTIDRLNKEVSDRKWEMHRKDYEKEKEKEGSKKDEKSDKKVEEDFDLNNGYDEVHYADKNDYFPDGADSPVVSRTGASGARQGDNPEQKKIAVAETHRELVYNYRKYLKESESK